MDDGFDFFEVNEDGKPYNIRQRCFLFAKSIILFVSSSKYDRIYFSIFDQLVRSSTSIGANLVEAMAGSSKKDWQKFHVISLKSANETKYWLCLIKETIDTDNAKIIDFLKEVDELSKIIASIVIKSKTS